VTPKRPILGIGKVSSDLSLSLIFPLRVEHLDKKVERYLKKVLNHISFILENR